MIEIRTSLPEDRAPNITPLVDIVFLLLIFFMLTAFFIRPEGMGVNVPEADAPAVDADSEITVVVDKEGAVLLGDVPVTLEELSAELAAALSADPTRPVVIKADRGIALQRAEEVMETSKKASAERLVIATESAVEPR